MSMAMGGAMDLVQRPSWQVHKEVSKVSKVVIKGP